MPRCGAREPIFDLAARGLRLPALLLWALAAAGAWAQPGGQPVPFVCDGSIYIVHDENAQLARFEQGGTTFSLSDLGPSHGFELNNLGFRRDPATGEGFLYAARLRRTGNDGLVRIDRNGEVFEVGQAGLPTSRRFAAGDVSFDGSTMVLQLGAASGDPIFVVDLTQTPPTSFRRETHGDTGSVADWAFHHRDGLLYGADHSDGQVAVLDPATGLRTDKTVTPPLPTGTAYGAAWLNAAGDLFVYRNNGQIFRIHDPAGNPTYDGFLSGEGTSRNDGAACLAFLGAAKAMRRLGDELPTGVEVTYTFENFGASGDPQAAVGSLAASDDLVALLGTPEVDWSLTSITSSRPGLANPSFDGAADRRLIAPGQGLAGGETARVTVRLELSSLRRSEPCPAGFPAGSRCFCNQIEASGTLSAFGVLHRDRSAAGLEADPDGDGIPSEAGAACLVLPAVETPQADLVVTLGPVVASEEPGGTTLTARRLGDPGTGGGSSVTAVPGGELIYRFTVTNRGPGAAPATGVTAALPDELSCLWRCFASPGAVCTRGPVRGALADTADLPAGASLLYTLFCRVGTPGGATLVSEFSALPAPGVEDPDPGNNRVTAATEVAGPRLRLRPETTRLPDGRLGEPYAVTFETTGGRPPITFATGTAPAGLAFSEDGGTGRLTLAGRPEAAGTFTFTVEARDSGTPPLAAAREYRLTVGNLPSTVPPDAVASASYCTQLELPGHPGPLLWRLVGAPPPGLHLDRSGWLGGVPARRDNLVFETDVTDPSGVTQRHQVRLRVRAAALVNFTPPLPDALRGRAYRAPILVTGGQPPYTCTLESGALPLDVALEGCVLTGRPREPGTSSFEIRVTDSAPRRRVLRVPLTLTVAGRTEVPFGEPPLLEAPTAMLLPEQGLAPAPAPEPDESVEALATDLYGQHYLVGSSFDGDDHDLLIVKLDPAGALVWSRTLDFAGDDFGHAVAVDPVEQGIYVAGVSRGINTGTVEAVVAFLDSCGVERWRRRLPEVFPALGDRPTSLFAAAADKGGVFAAGERDHGGDLDGLAVRLDRRGAPVWAEVLDSGDLETVFALGLRQRDGAPELVAAGAKRTADPAGWVITLDPASGAELSLRVRIPGSRLFTFVQAPDGTVYAGGDDGGAPGRNGGSGEWRLFRLSENLSPVADIRHPAGILLSTLGVTADGFLYAAGWGEGAGEDALVTVFSPDLELLGEARFPDRGGADERLRGLTVGPSGRLVGAGELGSGRERRGLLFTVETGKEY